MRICPYYQGEAREGGWEGPPGGVCRCCSTALLELHLRTIGSPGDGASPSKFARKERRAQGDAPPAAEQVGLLALAAVTACTSC